MTYAFDPELAAIVPGLPVIDLADVEAARQALDALFRPTVLDEPTQPVHSYDRLAPGPQGAPDVAIRIYRPKEQDRDLPGLLHIHGGGFMSGSIAQTDSDCVHLAAACDVVVVAVEYRLAPENPFPAAVEDCYAALLWAADHAEELGIDPSRLGVGGVSAGGGLSAAVALMARDRGGPL